MVWYSHLSQNFPQFLVIHTVKGFGIVNKAEIDVFLELSCFFHDPADVGNLISGSSAFSKASLNVKKLVNYCLLLSSLEGELHPRRLVPSSHWLVSLWISWVYLILIYMPRSYQEVLEVAPAFRSCCSETFLLSAVASAWWTIPPEKWESVTRDSRWEKQNKAIGDSTDLHSLNSQLSLAGILLLWEHVDGWSQVRQPLCFSVGDSSALFCLHSLDLPF